MSEYPTIPSAQALDDIFVVQVHPKAVATFDQLYAVTRMLDELGEIIDDNANEDYAPMMKGLIAAAQAGLADVERFKSNLDWSR